MGSNSGQGGRGRVLARVFLFLLGCALLLIVASTFASRIGPTWSPGVVGFATSLATLALALVFVRWDGVRLADVGALPTRGSVPRFFFGFAVGIFLVGAQSALFGIAEHARWIRSGPVEITPILTTLAVYCLLACREELAFRGYPLRRLDRRFGPWTAQWIVAVVFVLEHRAGGYSWTNAVFGALVGSLLFGMASLATRGLALPIGLHAAWNFGQWMIGEKESPGLYKAIVPETASATADHVGLMAYVVVFGFATAGFWWYGKTRTRFASVSRDES